MLPRDRRRALGVTAVAGTLAVVVVFASMWWRQRPLDAYLSLFLLHNGPPAVVLLWMSRLVLLRRPGNGAGRVLLAIGLLSVAHSVAAALADARIVAAGFSGPEVFELPQYQMAWLPLDAAVPVWVQAWIWVPTVVLTATVLLLLFPDGQLPGPRWRWASGAALGGAALFMLGNAIDAWPGSTWTNVAYPPVIDVLLASGGLLIIGATVASVVALALRWRRAPAGQRYPYRMIGATAGTMALVMILLYPTPWWDAYIVASLISLYALLTVYSLAVARYRLHDLEPLLGRAAVAGILSVVAILIYVGIVIGAGTLVSRRFEDQLLALLAVAVVAVAVEPVRRRARRLVDRVLFRRHADRTEVVSQLAARTTGSPGAAAVLADAVELLVRSTGASRAEAWLGGSRVAATGPPPAGEPVLEAEIVHSEQRIGTLRLFAHASVDLTPDAAAVLGDVANVVGVAVHNDQLSAQLRERLEQLQAVSRRLVEAQDSARRSLERDLHDGVQTRLLSIRMRAGAAHALASGRGLGELADALGTVADEVDSAVTELRGLARGLYPPVLRSSGVASALTLHCQDLGTPVTVEADGVGRWEPAVETALYFTCLEAVQNAVRHAGARRVTVRLAASGDGLRFTVADDGVGFDPATRTGGTGLTNMDDRITALRGHMTIDSAPGRGTQVTGVVPAQPRSVDR
ncbi:sensor histidine kinase [Luedemannella helvata]|uniref:Histidine kinase domain-containing protein n=1 Tax=Luedemannella helvata TaxID=349315 RepID=A0ABP4W1U6_9ACTN